MFLKKIDINSLQYPKMGSARCFEVLYAYKYFFYSCRMNMVVHIFVYLITQDVLMTLYPIFASPCYAFPVFHI